MGNLCSYGCGQESNYQLKNGKWCCRKNATHCPKIREKAQKTCSLESVKEKSIKKQKETRKNYLFVENSGILCDYGCGQMAKYQFTNKNWCCSNHQNKCSKVREKRKGKNIRINYTRVENSEHICDYGCGKEAKYQFKNGKWCCEDFYTKCKEFIKRNKKSKKKNEYKPAIINGSIICDYGCGQPAKYQLKNGKWCCSKNQSSCVSKTFSNKIENTTGILCSYGCGQEAKYQFKGGKYCCSESYNSCLENKKKNSKTKMGENNPMFGKPITEEHRRKKVIASTGIKQSKETRAKKRISYLENIENRCGQVTPNYNKYACKLIEEYGNVHDYNFQHAENGGEYLVKGLGYWLDGYDKEKNVAIEIDEAHHFNVHGNLKKKDVQRQKEIEDHLKCKFIRLKI